MSSVLLLDKNGHISDVQACISKIEMAEVFILTVFFFIDKQ